MSYFKNDDSFKREYEDDYKKHTRKIVAESRGPLNYPERSIIDRIQLFNNDGEHPSQYRLERN